MSEKVSPFWGDQQSWTEGLPRTSNFPCSTSNSPRQMRQLNGLHSVFISRPPDPACRPAPPRSSQPCCTCTAACLTHQLEEVGGLLRWQPFVPRFCPMANAYPSCTAWWTSLWEIISFLISQIRKMGRYQNGQEWCPNLSCIPESTRRWVWCQIHGHSRWEVAPLPAAFKPTPRPTFQSLC